MAITKSETVFEIGDLVRLKGMPDCPPFIVACDVRNTESGRGHDRKYVAVTRFNSVTGLITENNLFTEVLELVK